MGKGVRSPFDSCNKGVRSPFDKGVRSPFDSCMMTLGAKEST
jgi:hypothetical protein